ncbi:dienelactone hydrolase family protein [Vampirovibrio chlorellavorus]|uniref:dienelactone hydrolase family protein n=1 Tax=Vampirovibrio chlorellavorus TaxID=758823 RepID=UPI0026F14376|nr:dienelactone hydrolase family protein [Vampirovibrio chlorellavorus]
MTQPVSSQQQVVRTEWVTIPVEGQGMQAYLARPQGEGPWPAVVVLMEIFGINSHIRQVTERIAAEGYVALAINYYHRTTENFELEYTEAGMTVGRQHKDQTTRQGILEDLRASAAYLGQQPFVRNPERMASIGFCYGGHVACIAATLPPFVASIAFYPGGVAYSAPGGGKPTIEYAPDMHGQILCLFGKEDPLIPVAETHRVEAVLQQAQCHYEVIRYDEAGHGFFCDQRADYRPEIAEDAWRRVKALLSQTLKH